MRKTSMMNQVNNNLSGLWRDFLWKTNSLWKKESSRSCSKEGERGIAWDAVSCFGRNCSVAYVQGKHNEIWRAMIPLRRAYITLKAQSVSLRTILLLPANGLITVSCVLECVHVCLSVCTLTTLPRRPAMKWRHYYRRAQGLEWPWRQAVEIRRDLFLVGVTSRSSIWPTPLSIRKWEDGEGREERSGNIKNVDGKGVKIS